MRFFYVKQTGGALQPAEQVDGLWSICDTTTVKNFSAIGYFFGRAIYDNVKVPVGLIQSAWGGTPAEFWMNKETMRTYPELKDLVDNYEKKLSLYPAKLDDDKSKEPLLLAQWMADTAKARAEHKPIPGKPQSANSQYESLKRDAGGLYNSMIHPLIPFAMKGVIWYQGEANSSRAKQYQTLFPALINSWRQEWQQGDFPFLFVQLAPYKGNSPELREAQLLTFKKTTHTAMVVTTDCADSIDNVHPPFKQPIGQRLALAARVLAYHEKIEYSGPVYQDMKIADKNMTLRFNHIGKGLVAKNGELTGFTISGDGKKFIPAKAMIQGDNVLVFSDDVSNPVAVRYGWNNVPRDNLFNADGLPASPFRTDVP
jgi:sialate O-acetylesterase